MKTPAIFKPLAKTIVTEIKHFLVDSVRRTGITSHSVATKVTDTTLTQQEVVVGPDNPFILKDVHNVLSIHCPYPVKAELISFGSIPEPEVRSEQVYYDAEIETVGENRAGRFITLRVTDKDIYTAAPLSADVMNMRTGETETVSLVRKTHGVYEGFLQTQNNDVKGVDFDDVMYCQKDDILRATYAEAYAANGLSREISLDIVVTLDFAETYIEVPDTIPFDSFLNLRVKNPVSGVVRITNVRTSTQHVRQLSAFTPIQLGYEDTDNGIAVQAGDSIIIVTQGKDIYGQIVDISKTVRISETTVTPLMQTPRLIDISEPFTITLQDYNLPSTASIKITNGVTGVQTVFPMVSEYEYSGRFSLSPSLTAVGLPGQQLVVSYTIGGVTVTQNVDTHMGQTPNVETPVPVVNTESAPVTLTINGLFMLNGSFAGTVKLYADKPVRCTLIKA